MKKVLMGLALMSLVILVGACGKKADTTASSNQTTKNERGDKIIKVASQTTPMTDVVEKAAEVAKKDGWEIQLVRVNDNIQYNELLNNKEVDANFAQHEPFMQKFNEEKNGNLVVIQKIYDAKVGYYSKNYKDTADIPNGATIAIPNDTSNEGRALAILNDVGLIALKEGVGYNGTTKDVVENPHDFKWLAVDLLNLAEAYNEKDVAMVYDYPTYIAKIGLKPADAILLEKNIDTRFAISLVAREDNKDSAKIQELKKAMTSPEVKEFLEKEHSDTLLPSF